MLRVVIRIPDRIALHPLEAEALDSIEIDLYRCKLESCQTPIDHDGFCSKAHNNEFQHQRRKMSTVSGD
jgi:hypothetical protein